MSPAPGEQHHLVRDAGLALGAALKRLGAAEILPEVPDADRLTRARKGAEALASAVLIDVTRSTGATGTWVIARYLITAWTPAWALDCRKLPPSIAVDDAYGPDRQRKVFAEVLGCAYQPSTVVRIHFSADL